MKTNKYEHKGDTNFIWCIGTIPKRLVKGLGTLEIKGKEDTIQTTVL